MPSSIPGGVPEKLSDLMTHACELWRMCNTYELLKSVLYTPGRTEIFIDVSLPILQILCYEPRALYFF